MPTLRIALAFLAVLAAWIVFLPMQPTLLSPPPAVEDRAIMPPASPSMGAAPPAASGSASGRMERPAAVREVIPSPLAAGGDLVRMPAAASGAAVPPVADLAVSSAPKASEAEAGLTFSAGDPASETTPTNDGPVVVATTTPGAQEPDFRRFSQPIAVDSGTIQSGPMTLRVAGVEPIAPDARCSDGARSWPCGVRARTAFRAWLRGRSLLCSVPPDAGDDATVPCLLGEEDVGQWLVSNGWAAAAAGSRYAEAETEAKAARRGIWEFEIDN